MVCRKFVKVLRFRCCYLHREANEACIWPGEACILVEEKTLLITKSVKIKILQIQYGESSDMPQTPCTQNMVVWSALEPRDLVSAGFF